MLSQRLIEEKSFETLTQSIDTQIKQVIENVWKVYNEQQNASNSTTKKKK